MDNKMTFKGCKYAIMPERGGYLHLPVGCSHPDRDDGICRKSECPLKYEADEQLVEEKK